MTESPRTIAFERVDPAANARRLYTIRVEPSLYHAHALTIARGRIGSPLVVRLEEFVTVDQLTRRWRELVGRRRRHGYKEV